MPATDDEIREKYLERAIRELNTLTRELQACELCPRGHRVPVLGSGHPQADILLLKHAARASEVEEGVAFYGRAGTALMKSLKRLSIDPLAVYGTLCVKCPVADPSLADPACVGRLVEEIAIVQPRMIVVMGGEALTVLNELALPLAKPLEPTRGVVQPLTPSVDALVVPSIDDSLDEEASKRAFWSAFKVLGEWYADLPPY
ncbi:MAG TPA: uracil-DNA glycosylase family protein [Solirubrobacteraceae bacterium]|nr:uracil-DNA glycosylase family protein [Solirubrobacteraceae bacterium]